MDGVDEADYYHFCNYYDSQLSLVRADEQAVSLQKLVMIYLGGAHNDYGLISYNIDSKTGKAIALKQVASDYKALAEPLIAHLPRQYPDASFFDYQQTINSLFAKADDNEQGAESLEHHWSLTPKGIQFHFDPYELACFADGLLTLDIDFAKNPQLFNPANAKRFFAHAAKAVKKSEVKALFPEHYESLCGKWKMVSCENEGDTVAAKKAGIDCTLEIERGGGAHFKYKQGSNGFDDNYLRVKVTKTQLYEGCPKDWSAMLCGSIKRDYSVTILPDGTLRMLMFSYRKGSEYPTVMMGTFKRI